MSLLRRRALPVAALVGLAILVVLLEGRGLLVLIGLVQAAGLALGVELWRRQGEQLRREQALVVATQRMAVELGGRAKGAIDHEDQARSVHGQLRLLEARTKKLADQGAALGKAQRELARDAERVERETRRARHRDFQQVEGLFNLYTRFPPTDRMPGLRSWAISPDLLLAVIDLVLKRRPRTIVELGAGSSTLWLAHVLRTTGLEARIVTLEHDPFWAQRVSGLLAEQGLARFADVRLAPLTAQDVGGEEWPWYDPSGWSDLSDIDLVLVDGPPMTTGPLARYPAMPLLGDRLSEAAVVVMDDAIRADEQEIATRWGPLLEGYERLDLPVEKKAIIFARGPVPVL